MKYGLYKKLTSWGFWLQALLICVIIRIISSWMLIVVFGDTFTWKEWFIYLFINIVVYLLGTLLTEIFVRKSYLFVDDVDFDEVEREVKKNKELWNRIKVINEEINPYDEEFEKEYPPRKRELIKYKKTHQLKRYEEDYINWILEYYNERYKEKNWEKYD